MSRENDRWEFSLVSGFPPDSEPSSPTWHEHPCWECHRPIHFEKVLGRWYPLDPDGLAHECRPAVVPEGIGDVHDPEVSEA